jgi:hypothetical protein
MLIKKLLHKEQDAQECDATEVTLLAYCSYQNKKKIVTAATTV